MIVEEDHSLESGGGDVRRLGLAGLGVGDVSHRSDVRLNMRVIGAQKI